MRHDCRPDALGVVALFWRLVHCMAAQEGPTVGTMRRADIRIELLRVIGALSVFAYHFSSDVRSVVWPAAGSNAWWVAASAPLGPFGVALFIVISGVVFTWARANDSLDFIRRRLATLFPLYWWIAVPLILLALIAHRMPWDDLWKVPVWLSGLGILSRATLFPVVDGWWYITLALQLALVYPVLSKVQNRLGAEVFVLGCALVAILSVLTLRALGWDYANGGFVGSRLTEFAVGMTIGRFSTVGAKGGPRGRVLASAGVAVAVWATVVRVSPLVALAPVVVWLAVANLGNASGRLGRWIGTAGGLSFAFYLSHSPWARPVLTSLARVTTPATSVVLGGALSLGGAILIAWGFLSSFAWAGGLWEARRSRG
jgi:peptidoglycan/LPS O-acetylase OafA/YrhL